MAISIRGDDTWVTVNVTGPRGRIRQVRAKIDLTIDKDGIHNKAQFVGPLGGMWSSRMTISFQEIIDVIKQKPGGLKSFLQFAPGDLAYVLREIMEA